MVYEVKEVDLSRLETFAEHMDADWPQQLVQSVASRAHRRWVQLIGEKLQTSQLAYRQALHVPEMDGQGRVIISLGGEDGRFAVMVEEGADAYDLHDTILKGRDYAAVPFRHKGADSGYASPGTPAGRQFIASQGKEEALKIGRRVMRQARKLQPYQPGTRQFGTRLKAGLAPQLKEHHTTDIFAGLARIRESNKKGAASTYLTWRAISKSNQDGTKWMHPGIKAKRLLDIVVADIEEIANSIADGMIEGILFHNRRTP